MPSDLTMIDDLLRSAYADLSSAIQQEDLCPDPPAEPERRRRTAERRHRWFVPVAAAAAVLAVVLAAALIPLLLQGGGRVAPGASRNMAYVVTGTGTVIPLDLANGTTRPSIRLGVPGGPTGMVMTPNGKTIYVLTVRGQVTPVSTVTGRADRPMRIGGVAQGMVMTPNGLTGYVLEPPYGVAVVNFGTNSLATFIKIHDADGFALAPSGKVLYVSSSNGSTVTPVDTTTNRALPPIRLPSTRNVLCGVFCRDIAITPDGKTAYVFGERREVGSLQEANVITPISTATNTPGAPIELLQTAPIRSLTISPDGSTGYVVTNNSVIPVDLATGRQGKAIVVAPSRLAFPELSLAIPGDGRTLYVLEPFSNRLLRINTATGTPLGSVSVANSRWHAGALVVSPDGRTLYVLSDPTSATTQWNRTLVTPVKAASSAVGKSIELSTVGLYIVFSPR